MFVVEGIDHVALAVRDVGRSVAWYEDVLGLERWFKDEWGDYPAVLGAGTTAMAFFPVQEIDPQPSSGNSGLTMRHVVFRVDGENFKEARADLERLQIAFTFQDHTISHSTTSRIRTVTSWRSRRMRYHRIGGWFSSQHQES